MRKPTKKQESKEQIRLPHVGKLKSNQRVSKDLINRLEQNEKADINKGSQEIWKYERGCTNPFLYIQQSDKNRHTTKIPSTVVKRRSFYGRMAALSPLMVIDDGIKDADVEVNQTFSTYISCF